jgi:hypothetical protein
MAEVQEGKFPPDRENDELTKALKNPEHIGWTRSLQTATPWRTGILEYSESYRIRARAKKRKEPEEA